MREEEADACEDREERRVDSWWRRRRFSRWMRGTSCRDSSWAEEGEEEGEGEEGGGGEEGGECVLCSWWVEGA